LTRWRGALRWACAIAACTATACSGGGGHASPPAPGATVADGAPSDDDAGGSTGPADTGSDAPATTGPSSPDAASNATGDGAALDAGAADSAANAAREGGAAPDGGTRDVGSCCSAQTTPGCDDSNLELCVCQKIPSCCTTAWTLACALIVQQKYCQGNVRDCVCGTDAGQWGQAQCCTTDWSSTCDSVATLKCNAVTGCF